MEIQSCANVRVKQWAKYHEKKYRELDQKFLVEGEHLIKEACKADLVEVLIVSEDCPYEFDFTGEIIYASREVMKKLSGNVSVANCIGVCHYLDHVTQLGKKVILLDDVQDPGNVGTIIRSAHSFGFDSVVLSNKSVDIYNEKLIRSTQGAVFFMPLVKGDILETMERLKAEGIKIYATALQDAKPLSDFSNQEAVALVLGNEGSGVSRAVLDACDDRIFIEMHCFESLNVAIAGGICMYAFRK